ncbi:MAG TPA: addiction module antidote protein [Chromatiaceae bacterium]|nr:addiction module antidote protein [Chromatiaceae bacterium]
MTPRLSARHGAHRDARWRRDGVTDRRHVQPRETRGNDRGLTHEEDPHCRSTRFDPAEHLKDEDDIAAYLTIILEENDLALLAAALGEIARARGMTEIAKASRIARGAVYKALRPGAQPYVETIAKVCGALGVKLAVQPAHGRYPAIHTDCIAPVLARRLCGDLSGTDVPRLHRAGRHRRFRHSGSPGVADRPSGYPPCAGWQSADPDSPFGGTVDAGAGPI